MADKAENSTNVGIATAAALAKAHEAELAAAASWLGIWDAGRQNDGLPRSPPLPLPPLPPGLPPSPPVHGTRNCWAACGGAGACDSFCGASWACCFKGEAVPGCAVDSPCVGYHCCVPAVEFPPPSRPPSPPSPQSPTPSPPPPSPTPPPPLPPPPPPPPPPSPPPPSPSSPPPPPSTPRDCYDGCRGQGLCDDWCGSGKACCRSHYTALGCPLEACHGYHCCVVAEPLPPPSPPPHSPPRFARTMAILKGLRVSGPRWVHQSTSREAHPQSPSLVVPVCDARRGNL